MLLVHVTLLNSKTDEVLFHLGTLF